MKSIQTFMFLPSLLFPDVVRTLTPTISGTFELTTLTLHTGEKARFQSSKLLLRVRRQTDYKNVSNIYHYKHISTEEIKYQAR